MKTKHILLPTLLWSASITQAQTINNISKKETMSTIQHNEAIVRSLYEQSLNQRNMGILHDLFSDDYPGFQGIKGAAGFEKSITGLIKAFPDIQWNIEDLFGEGDEVAVRWRWKGTHTGPFNGHAQTGKTITNDGMAIFALKEGKIISSQVQTDRLGFLQEINVVPTDLTQPAVKPVHKDKVNFIDKFFVPAAAKAEFYDRMHKNRSFLETLPGLIQQDAYEYSDKDGNLIVVSVAQWESKEAIEKAKEAVQAEYKREGFDMPAMLKRLNITVDRGIYTDLHEQ
jgi:predicted ester cyclase